MWRCAEADLHMKDLSDLGLNGVKVSVLPVKRVLRWFAWNKRSNPLTAWRLTIRQVVQLIIRELRVLGKVNSGDRVEFKLSLDGRPFWGSDSVMVGLMNTSDSDLAQVSSKATSSTRLRVF